MGGGEGGKWAGEGGSGQGMGGGKGETQGHEQDIHEHGRHTVHKEGRGGGDTEFTNKTYMNMEDTLHTKKTNNNMEVC